MGEWSGRLRISLGLVAVSSSVGAFVKIKFLGSRLFIVSIVPAIN